MELNLTQLSPLLGSQARPSPNVYDLVTGNNRQTIEQASLSSALQGEKVKNLTETQTSTLNNLRNFVTENVSEQDQASLFESIDALENLFEFGNFENSKLDPVLSLLADSSNLNLQPSQGLFFDQLI